jgi:FMN-dependent NADH-azoreductase
MAKVLYIEASPRKERSASIEVANNFLNAYRAANPQDTVETLDLWATQLPRFDQSTIDAKYAIMHGQPHTAEQKAAWEAVERVAAQFKAADKYVFSLPMWNFGVPYILKHYIDVLLQPGLTFSFTPSEGYKGLVTGKPALVIYAQGGQYPKGTPWESYDLQSKYLELVLGFIGFTDVKSVYVNGTLNGADGKDKAVTAGTAEAVALAAKF